MTTWTKHRETQKLLEEAEAAGLEIELSNAGHILVRPPGAGGGGTTVSKRPGDHREIKNARSQIRRIIQGVTGQCRNSWHLENSGERFCPWCSGTWKDKDRPKPSQEDEVRRDMNKNNVPQREKLECPTCPEWFWIDQKLQYTQHVDWCRKNVELKSQEATVTIPLGDRIVEAVNEYNQPLSVDDIATLVNVTPIVAGRVLTDLVRIKKIVKKGTMFAVPEKPKDTTRTAGQRNRADAEIRPKIRTFLQNNPTRSFTPSQVAESTGFTWDQVRWALSAMARTEPENIQITSGKSRKRTYRWVTSQKEKPMSKPMSNEVVFEDPPDLPMSTPVPSKPSVRRTRPKGTIRDQIRIEFQHHPDMKYTPAQMATAIGVSEDTARWAMSSMAQQGDPLEISMSDEVVRRPGNKKGSRERLYRWTGKRAAQTSFYEREKIQPQPEPKETPMPEPVVLPTTTIIEQPVLQPPDPNKSWKWIPGKGFVEDVSVPAVTVFEYITTDKDGRLLIRDDKGVLYFATPI